MLTQNPRHFIWDGSGVLGDLLDDEASPGVGACVGGGKGPVRHSLDPASRDLSEIETVVDPEVHERRKVLLVYGVPEPKLGLRSAHRTSAGWADRRSVPVSLSGRATPLGPNGRARARRRSRGVVEPSTMTTSKWSAGRLARLLAFRLWIEAKTWSKRVGREPPTHFSPNEASRSA